jgi:cytochrome c oxidase subunit II
MRSSIIESYTMTENPHLTTRRGFIALAGLGGTSLYGLWAAYGAAPNPLSLLFPVHDGSGEPAHDRHLEHEEAVSSFAEFEERVRDFIARYAQPDGSVYPRRLPAPVSDHAHAAHGDSSHRHAHSPQAAADAHAHDVSHAGHAQHDSADHVHDEHGAHAGHDESDSHIHDDHAIEVIDVYLLAAKWYFEPGHLRLQAGQRYRFRMMAEDVSHGASIQFGRGARMIRLRPGRLAEQEFTFHRPGELLVYCTVYCGVAHDMMQARISVVAAAGGAA